MRIRQDRMAEEAGTIEASSGATTAVAASTAAPFLAPAQADAAVVAHAAEAIAQTRQALAQADAAKAQAEASKAALEQRLAALEAKPTAPPEALDTITRYMARERNDRRLDTVRRMGLDVRLSDAQVLGMVPDVDPRDPDGLAKLEQWRGANSALFTSQGKTQKSIVDALKTDLQPLGNGLFSTDKLIGSLFGGKQ